MKTIYPILFFFIVLLSSCSENNNSSTAVTPNPKANFELKELLGRGEGLSQEEYKKIENKYNRLKTQYQNGDSRYESLLKLAEIYIYEARVTGEHPYYYTAALNTLEEVITNKAALTKDQQFTATFYKATVQLSQHNFGQALETGQKALAINDMNAGIYGVLVDANVEIGNYEEAVKMCQKMMSLRPDLRSYSRTSYLREIYGDLTGSKKAMARAITAGAPYSEYKCWAIVTMGKIYEAEGKLDSAAMCYEMATTERKNYPFGIAGKARIAAKKGELDIAEKTYNEAIAIVPEIGFNIELAGLKKQQGATADVDKMVGEIEEMFKEDIESGHNMNLEFASFLMTFKDDYQTALEYGLNEYKLRPNNIDVNKLLAFAYYGLDDIENADKHVNIALATSKKDAALICVNGLIKQDKQKIQEAFDLNPYQEHIFVDKAKDYLKS
jgi:tetratricopeptide (TPR) repeat protein